MKFVLASLSLVLAQSDVDVNSVDLNSLLQFSKIKADIRAKDAVDMDCEKGPEHCQKKTTTTTTPSIGQFVGLPPGKPPLCAIFKCGDGFSRSSLGRCTGFRCTTEQCCQPLPTCSDYTCPLAYAQTSVDAECAEDGCGPADCCEKHPTCSDYSCPAEFEQTSHDDVCVDGTCGPEECCEKHPTCGDYTCSSEYEQTDFSSVCTSGNCGPSDCCQKLPTCKTYTCKGAYKQKSSDAVCTGGSCGPTDCCEKHPTCAEYECDASVYDQKSFTAVCTDGSCGVDECCTEHPTCSDYTCPMAYEETSGAEVCDDGNCDVGDCCKKKPTCEAHKCSDGYKEGPYKQKICHDGTCDDGECCKKLPTCASYGCPAAYKKISTKDVCKSGKCGPEDCCEKYPTCSTYKCPEKYKQTSLNNVCRGGSCGIKECCEKHPTCAGYTCPSNYKQMFHSLVCESGDCGTADCCKKLPTCATVQCPPNYKRFGAKICSDGLCDQRDCCEKLPTCAAYTCPSGYDKLSDSKVCHGGSCNRPECCQRTTTTTTTLGRRMTCKVYGDPQVTTFDGLTEKSTGFRESQLDCYKSGDYWLVHSDNIKVQARLSYAGSPPLSKSVVSELLISGPALGTRTIDFTLESGRGSTSIGMYKYNGRSTRGDTTDSFVQVGAVKHRTGTAYTVKFPQDSSVELMIEPKQFANVPQGMIDVTISMNQRGGVNGFCGNMNNNRNDDKVYLASRMSTVGQESSFPTPLGPQPKPSSKECTAQEKAKGTTFCQKLISDTRSDGFKTCQFDYCNGGEEVAKGDMEFLKDSQEFEKTIKSRFSRWGRRR